MALMQITVLPLGSGSTSVGGLVAEMAAFLDGEGVKYELTDMGTVVEGSSSDLLALAARVHEVPFGHGVDRVVTQIVIDDRRDRQVAIGDKVSSVKRRMDPDKK